MSGLINLVKQNYIQIVNETIVDETVNSWMLMGSQWPVLFIIFVYLCFVLKLGPQIMESRKPFTLKYVMICYNLYQVVFSTWICLKVLQIENGFSYLLNHGCHPLSRSINPTIYMGWKEATWLYLFAKVVELLDTVFFVLRKKQSQVTFLHVYHHSMIAISAWAYLKYIQGEQGVLLGFMNSFVHIIMYSYYLMAALGPKYQKYLWWKNYITKLQLGQFLLLIVYNLTLLAFNCKLHKALTVYIVINCVTFLYLFTDFYRKAYMERKDSKKSISKNKKKVS